MSENAPGTATNLAGELKIVVVASRFNENYVEGLIAHATAVWRERAPQAQVAIWRVPGAFEIPLLVAEVAARADVVVAFGVILQGETKHAVYLATTVSNALQNLALAQRVPVIHCVLDLENAEQAKARCLEDRINRGTEAAYSALETVETLRRVRAKKD